MTETTERSEEEVRCIVREVRAENRIQQGRKAMAMLVAVTFGNALRYAVDGWPEVPPVSRENPHPPWEAPQSTCWRLLAASLAFLLLSRWARKRPLPAMSLAVILILSALLNAEPTPDRLRPLAIFFLFGVLVYVARGIIGTLALPKLTDSTN